MDDGRRKQKMMTEELVSVVIPTYNRVDCVARAVDSALAQTHRHLEVLIIDDGSSDGTADLVRQRWAADPRVRYVYQANGGISAARNRALSLATGAFVAYLDSDDTWVPWKIQAQLACMARYPDAVLIHSDLDAVDSNGAVCVRRCLRALLPYHDGVATDRIYGEESRPLRELVDKLPEDARDARVLYGDAYSYLLLGNLMMPSAVMVRRNAQGHFDCFDESLRLEESYDYFLRVCVNGPVAFIDAATFRYERGRGDHLWKPEYPPQVAHRLSQSYLQVMTAAVARSKGRYLLPQHLLDRQMAGAHGAVADSAILVGDRGLAFRQLLTCVRLHPRQRRAWVLLAGTVLLPLRGLAALREKLMRARGLAASASIPAQ